MLQKNASYLFCLLLCLVSISACTQKSSAPFSDEAGKFQVDFPVKPEKEAQTVTTEFGLVSTVLYKAEPGRSDNNTAYEAGYVDYPEGYADTLSIENTPGFFASAQTTNLTTPEIELISTYNLQLLGYPGMEFRWKDTRTKKMFRIRFYLVNNRMYTLSVYTKEKDDFNLDINKFFESFKLLDTEPNPDMVAAPSTEVDKVYTVNFPKATEVRKTQVPTTYGNANVAMEMFQPKMKGDDNFAYAILQLSYSKDITQEADFDLEAHFDEVIATALNGRQSTLISRKSISQNGVKGVEFLESFRGGQIWIKNRIFLLKDQQISAQVMTIPENKDNKAINTFLNSLKFIKK